MQGFRFDFAISWHLMFKLLDMLKQTTLSMFKGTFMYLHNHKPSLGSGDLKRLGSVWFSRFVDQNNKQAKYTHSMTHNVDTIKLHIMF